jgi:RNA polymerase sigma factor (sigma-70 family)
MNSPLTAEMLAENRAWMRRLARALTSDAGLAEDLEQETWEAALRHPPRSGAPIRAWLRRVFVNRLRNEARGQGRRRAREAASAPDQVAATPEQLAARLELQHRLCVLVAEMDEPYRHVVHLRFFEDRDSPRSPHHPPQPGPPPDPHLPRRIRPLGGEIPLSPSVNVPLRNDHRCQARSNAAGSSMNS